ncbi:uncharacterized protein LOC143076871 [Mytilus galloprovincialis]|uniref:uncharacterized protein LOC143076871 n=1 Tax=Mytilus galloprovincialis TaxID=29158 RepID=UPI003F7BE08A
MIISGKSSTQTYPVDSSSYTQADNENKKGETTSDQWVNHIVNLLEEIEQDYSATAVEPSSGQTSSHRSSNGEIDNAVKNIQTTSDLDFNVKVMINLLEELDPDYISDTFETHQLSTCSLTDRSSDYSDELPDHVESIIDKLLDSNDTNNTFDLMNGS